MVVRISDKTQNYSKVTKLLVKPKIFFVLYLTHPHICRHTYCSNMIKAGVNPKVVQYLMGHSSSEITLNIYTHIHLEDVIEELEGVGCV